MLWNFDNTYAQLPEKLFTPQAPSKVDNPQTVIFNEKLASEIGLSFLNENQKRIPDYFSGNLLPDGSKAIAQAYAGHQFGHFNKLGDGRAILIGELLDDAKRRFDIQLKGSGRTPYSRGGDGRATLKSMLREYLISEGMHHLGIPSTRSLAVVTTGEKVFRPEPNEGAVLTRIAASHIRVGTFEYVKHFCSDDELKVFTEYTIQRHYPELMEADNPPLELVKLVMQKQVDLIVEWMRVGFIHGVMNTDNMSIAGESIDYGPCAFMNTYDPSTVFSSIDTQGRYSFENQPYIANWNLAIFAGTLLPLIDNVNSKAVEKAQGLLDGMKDIYFEAFYKMMLAKLGVFNPKESDHQLVNHLLQWMQENKLDYTDTFHKLSQSSFELSGPFKAEQFKLWFSNWRKTIVEQEDIDKSVNLMIRSNPVVIPRNHLVEEALNSAAIGDMSPFHNLLNRLQTPYKESEYDLALQNVPAGFDEGYRTFCGT